jgi:hypothetical protein
MRAPSQGIFRKASRRAVAALLLLAFSACSTVRVETRPATGKARIAIAVYPSDQERKAGRPGPYGVLSELYFWEQGSWKRVKVSMLPSWGVEDPPPGKYMVKVEKRISEAGHIEDIKGKKSETFTLKGGQDARVDVLIKGKPPVGLIVVGVLVSAAIIWAIVEALSGGGSDLPLPPLDLPAPVVVDMANVFFHIALEMDAGRSSGRGDSESPRLIANFPLLNDPHADPATHIFLNFSQPVKNDWDDEVLQVVGDQSGLVKGRLEFHPGGDMVEFIPNDRFQPGEHVTVTLDGVGVEDRWGNGMEGKVSFTFDIRQE